MSLSGRSRVWLHSEGVLHVWYHLALFGVLGLLAIFSSERLSVRIALLITAALLGVGMEYIETLRYSIDLEVNDICTDACGIAIGALLGWLLSFRSRKQQ